MARTILPLSLALTLLALLLCGCLQETQTTVTIDPAYQTTSVKTVAVLPIDEIVRAKLTIPQQLAVYAQMTKDLQRARPGVTVIGPEEALERLEAGNSQGMVMYEGLCADFTAKHLPNNDVVASLASALHADGFVFGQLLDMSGNKDKFEGYTSIHLTFAFYATTGNGMKALWSNDCLAKIDIPFGDDPRSIKAVLEGIDYIFNTMPAYGVKEDSKHITGPQRRWPGE